MKEYKKLNGNTGNIDNIKPVYKNVLLEIAERCEKVGITTLELTPTTTYYNGKHNVSGWEFTFTVIVNEKDYCKTFSPSAPCFKNGKLSGKPLPNFEHWYKRLDKYNEEEMVVEYITIN